jgi:hypothetical protein
VSWQQWALVAWFSFALLMNVNAVIQADDRIVRAQHMLFSSVSMAGIWLSANA